MRILVTGGCGFIGSHVIRRWRATHPGDEIVNLDVLTYAASTARVEDVARLTGYRLVRGDVTDPRQVAMAVAGCQVVVHCAAETHVDRSITNAAPFVRTNVEGTRVLLEEARRAGVERILHVSTDEVYGPMLSGEVNETARLAPRSPYAASKAAADGFVLAYHHSYGVPVVVARPTNAYGPGQFPEKFIPLCITRALEQQPIPLYGDGSQRRSWLFVEDLCRALEVLVSCGEPGEIYNIGSGHEAANLQTATAVLQLVGCGSGLLQHVPDRPGHDWRYGVEDSKLRALGWAPATEFREGLARTVTWYRHHADWWLPLVAGLREESYHWLDSAEPRAARTDTARAD